MIGGEGKQKPGKARTLSFNYDVVSIVVMLAQAHFRGPLPIGAKFCHTLTLAFTES